ncbi:hypothetical protein DSM101010T_19070 [Desulfovibrio subterraneus]|uniref:Uncharacterized protein n=1 Tax=Desulfovibrio subterraneus TaxID=2718620 RepID=A0A7J0BK48_9BACT|nr:hypothetical protein DSM101010T_19070 [Desulfovibrio subterraneus]
MENLPLVRAFIHCRRNIALLLNITLNAEKGEGRQLFSAVVVPVVRVGSASGLTRLAPAAFNGFAVAEQDVHVIQLHIDHFPVLAP